METSSTPIQADATLDLGAIGCDLLMEEIAVVMDKLTTGQTLQVSAYDPAAPIDIRVWCRKTGNTLVATLPDENGHDFLLRKGS